jgi:hypothetical protein
MINAIRGVTGCTLEQARTAAAGVLRDIEPFRFSGYPDNPVYIHPSCGTVVDVVAGSDTSDSVSQGECD